MFFVRLPAMYLKEGHKIVKWHITEVAIYNKCNRILASAIKSGITIIRHMLVKIIIGSTHTTLYKETLQPTTLLRRDTDWLMPENWSPATDITFTATWLNTMWHGKRACAHKHQIFRQKSLRHLWPYMTFDKGVCREGAYAFLYSVYFSDQHLWLCDCIYIYIYWS